MDTPRASRRERQILDVLHRLGPATVTQVHAEMDDPPSYTTVRTLLSIMESKGFVTHAERGKAYVYAPAVSARVARRSALRHVIETFFQGSIEDAAIALLEEKGLDDATRRRLRRRITQARRQGR